MPKNIYFVDAELDDVFYSVPKIHEITLGRNGLIKIPCRVEKSMNVSKIHCRLLRKDLEGEVTEHDFAVMDGESDKKPSKNGTYVNGERISNEKETPLTNDSIISLADYKLKVVIEGFETIEDSETI